MSTPTMPAKIEFAGGLVGLPDLHAFAVTTLDDSALVALDSLDDAGIGFVALPADLVRPGYTPDLRARSVVADGDDVLVLLSVHGDPPVATANMAGPIVVTAGGQARQLVLEGPGYGLREPVSLG